MKECAYHYPTIATNSRSAPIFNSNNVHEVSNLSIPEAMEINEAPRYFSRAYMRIYLVVVCASLYIVLFSSNGINLHVYQVDKGFSTPHKQATSNNLRGKRRVSLFTPSRNQVPIPDFDFQSSSDDDSVDDSEDDAPDDGADKPIIIGRESENVQNKLLSDGRTGIRKKLHPSLAHAKSLSSSQIPGVPKPKYDQDPIIYHYHDAHNNMADFNSRSQISDQSNNGNLQKNHRPPFAHDKNSLNVGMYTILQAPKENDYLTNNRSAYRYAGESFVTLYGDTKNQVFICFAWLFLVLLMMKAVRNSKRRDCS